MLSFSLLLLLVLLFLSWPPEKSSRHDNTEITKWNNNNGLQQSCWLWTCSVMRPHPPSVVPRIVAETGRWSPWRRQSCCLLISCISSTASWCQVLAVLMVTGKKAWVLYLLAILGVLVGCYMAGCGSRLSGCVSHVCIYINVWNCHVPSHWLGLWPRGRWKCRSW